MVHLKLLDSLWLVQNLNTSYAMVHRRIIDIDETVISDLNTSYVMVHHATEADKIFIISFKYILYYGSSGYRP